MYSPGMEAEHEEKLFMIETLRDSPIFAFLVKAETAGVYRLRMDLIEGKQKIAETLLRASATEFRPGPGAAGNAGTGVIASVELEARAVAAAAATAGSGGLR